jgi:trk system potassium uptake protein TrkA
MTLKPNDAAERAGTEPSREPLPAEWYVLGGGPVGAAVARQLGAEGHSVAVVDESHDPETVPGVRGDPADVEVLAEAGVADAGTVVVATRSDRRNLLVAQLVRARFGVERTVVLTNVPDRMEPVAAAGHEPVCATTALATALTATLTGQA